jgi:hypothetical protein
MDPTDFEYLTCMNRMLSDGASLARSYLANSDPDTRLAAVADLARTTITEHERIMGDVTGWLEASAPPPREHEYAPNLY